MVSVNAAVQDQKANTTLTILSLSSNKVGDAGASALAGALQATVLALWSAVVQHGFTWLLQVSLLMVM